jgi:uncharacterized RDD family membrane protein YckC
VEIDEWHPPTQAQHPDGPDAFPAAGVNSLAAIWTRAVARSIDTAVVMIPALLVFMVVAVVTGRTGSDDAAESTMLQAWVTGSVFVVSFLYETIGVTLWGQTLGKLICGIRVARLVNGRCPLWWEAGLRVALPGVVSAIPHPAALAASVAIYAVAVFDPIRRTLADRAAGTVVVRAR